MLVGFYYAHTRTNTSTSKSLTHQQCLSYTDYGEKPVSDQMNVHREIRLMGISRDYGNSDHGNRDHGNRDASDCTLSCHSCLT